MCGQRMVIRDKKETGVFMLHPDKILHCSKIISKMQVARAPNAADYNFFHVAKIRKAGKYRAEKGEGLIVELMELRMMN